jgi:hypothetical protein
MVKTHRIATLLMCGAVVGACSRPTEESAVPAVSPASAASRAILSSSSFVHGGTRAALLAYLQTVQETPAKKFEVTYNPDVVKIERQEAIDSLQAVSADGAEFRFTDGAKVRQLEAGKILFLWGIALRRITAAAAAGDQWVVTTVPVSLPEVFREADIDFDYPLDARQVFATFRPPAPAKTAALTRPDGIMPVAFISEARADEAPEGPTIIDLPNSYATSVNGIDIELSYQPIEGGLHFDIEARKQQSDVKAEPPKANPRSELDKYAEEKRKQDVADIRNDRPKSNAQTQDEANTAAKKGADDWKKTKADGPNAPNKAMVQALWGIGSDLWDLRIKASGDLTGISAADSLSVSNQLQIHGSALGLLKTEFHNVNGKLKLEFIARRGQNSEQWIEKLKVDIPIRFNIPVIVAGMPMVFQVGFDVIAQPALTTKNDTFDAAYEIPFSGSGNVLLDGNKFTVGGTLAAEPNPLKTLAASIGVSAILVAIQAPRIGLGVGVFGASSVVYIDLVSSATITASGELALAHCQQYQLVTSINAGVDTKIAFDLPGYTHFLNGPLNEKLKQVGNAASLREQIFKKEWYRVSPDVPICRPKSG